MPDTELASTIPFVLRDPAFYRRVAESPADEAFIRACLMLAAEDLAMAYGFTLPNTSG